MLASRPSWLKRAALAPFVRTRTTAGPPLLTFDDGPHPEHTPAVLDRLQAFGLTATFFLVGERARRHPQLVRRITDAGHVLGNHTFAHRRFGWWDVASPVRDVGHCQEVLPGARVFRPPFGRLTPGLWLAARRHRLECVGWSLDSGDWRCRDAVDAAVCGEQLAARVQPGDIVLLHDSHPWIDPILDVLLPALADLRAPDRAVLSPRTRTRWSSSARVPGPPSGRPPSTRS